MSSQDRECQERTQEPQEESLSSVDGRIYRLRKSLKSKSVHGLLKVPDEVIIQEKDKEIQRLSEQVAQLQSHVSNLQFQLRQQVNSDEVKRASYDTKREELYRQIRAINDSLRHRIKVLERSNKDLLNKLIKANKS